MRLLSVKRGYFVHFCLSLLVRVYRFCSHFCSQKSRCLIWDYTTCNLWLIGPCVSDSLTLVSCYFVRWCLSLFVVFHLLCCHFLKVTCGVSPCSDAGLLVLQLSALYKNLWRIPPNINKNKSPCLFCTDVPGPAILELFIFQKEERTRLCKKKS